MDTKAIADDFTALCKANKFDEAGETYWSKDIRSVEPMEGDMADLKGLDAVRGKAQWWAENHEIHDFTTEGPYVNHDQFVVVFGMDVTNKPSGQRIKATETAVYTVKDGKIVEERFFMHG